MAIDTLILWMTIDQHHHLTTAACYTAHVNTSSGSSGNTVTQHRARGHKKARHLLYNGGQDTGLILIRQQIALYHRHCLWQIARVCG